MKKTIKKKAVKKTIKKTVKKKLVRQKQIELHASAAGIWINCSGYVTLDMQNKNFFQSQTKAEIGTLTHKIIELYLSEQQQLKLINWSVPDLSFIETFIKFLIDRKPPKNLLSAKEKLILKSNILEISEMVLFCYRKIYLDIETILNDDDVTRLLIYSETKNENKAGNITLSGTSDFIIISQEQIDKHTTLRIDIYDFKTGWLEVHAENNSQLTIYAHQIIEKDAKIKKLISKKNTEVCINLIIIQPRLYQISTASVPYIPTYISTLIDDAKKSLLKPSFVCGTQCTYCMYNDVCKEFKKIFDKFLSPEYQDSQIDRPEKWGEILLYGGALKKMVETVKSTALLAAQAGVNIPGFYLDYKGTRRTWLNQLSIKQICSKLKIKKADIIDEKIKTPPQVEKFLKSSDDEKHKEALEELKEMVINPRVPVLKVQKD